MATPHLYTALQWPPNPEQWQALNDMLEDLYQRGYGKNQSAVVTQRSSISSTDTKQFLARVFLRG